MLSLCLSISTWHADSRPKDTVKHLDLFLRMLNAQDQIPVRGYANLTKRLSVCRSTRRQTNSTYYNIDFILSTSMRLRKYIKNNNSTRAHQYFIVYKYSQIFFYCCNLHFDNTEIIITNKCNH